MIVSVPSGLTEYVAALDPKHSIWVGGRGTAALSGATFAVEDPATGAPITSVADAGPDEATAAVDAAFAAGSAWAATPPRQRAEMLRRTFELMLEDPEPCLLYTSPSPRDS